MPEPAAPVIEAPVTPKPRPALDSSRPLAQQTARIMQIMEQMPEKKAEVPKSPDEPKPADPGQPVPETPAIPAPVLDDEDEPVAPTPLGTLEKYIIDKLPTLSTRIKDGETVKTVTFKDPAELPAGYELADDTARTQLALDTAAQFGRAKDAMNEYKQAEMQQNIREYETQEAKDVARDLARLQKAGLIPKFEKKEDEDGFNDDPGVKLANDIYKIFKDTNAEYARRFANSKSTYRMSFEDAANRYFATQARQAANDSQKAKEQPKEVKPKKEPTPAQKERQEIAKQSGAPSGGEPPVNKPQVKSGMTMNDINRLFRAGRI